MERKRKKLIRPLAVLLAAGGLIYIGRCSAGNPLQMVKERMGNKEYCVQASSAVLERGLGQCGGELEENLVGSYRKEPEKFRGLVSLGIKVVREEYKQRKKELVDLERTLTYGEGIAEEKGEGLKENIGNYLKEKK